MRRHEWFKISEKCGFLFCNRCGLINLKNPATHKLMNKPCPGKDED